MDCGTTLRYVNTVDNHESLRLLSHFMAWLDGGISKRNDRISQSCQQFNIL